MAFSVLLSALKLPDDARVDQRIPKKLLLEQGVPTAADKRQIQDGIDELMWVAALKPSNIGVPAFQDNIRSYEEIAILTLSLRPGAKASRIAELIHRAIPYPVALVIAQSEGVSFSLAHKRLSLVETNQVVIEKVEATKPFSEAVPNKEVSAFLNSLALSAQPTQDLFALYQGWIDRVVALAAALITGGYRSSETPEEAAVRRAALDEHAAFDREISVLRAKAEKEKQMDRLVDLNMEIKRLESKIALIKQQL